MVEIRMRSGGISNGGLDNTDPRDTLSEFHWRVLVMLICSHSENSRDVSAREVKTSFVPT